MDSCTSPKGGCFSWARSSGWERWHGARRPSSGAWREERGMPNVNARAYLPAVILAIGCVLASTVHRQRRAELRAPLAALPREIDGARGVDVPMDSAELAVGGMDATLMRRYGTDADAFGLYVGYSEAQSGGHSIHSPRNCLPGGGWEALRSGVDTIDTGVAR